MSIAYNGNIKVPCCHYKFNAFQWDVHKPLDIEKFWNNSWFQNLRQIFKSNHLENTGCAGCPNVLHDYLVDEAPPAGVNRRQAENYLKSIENLKKKEVIVNHSPCYFFFDFGLTCNFNCIMCSQADPRNLRPNRTQLSAKSLMDQIDTLAGAIDIKFIGGEPLFIKESRIFLEQLLTHPLLKDVGATLITNGYYLNDFLPQLKNKDRLSLWISLDSVGSTYEKIRVGSNWVRVSKNIDDLLKVRKAYNKSWQLVANAVLIKTSLPALPDFVAWCLERDIEINFQNIRPNRYTMDEDVLSNPKLLVQVKNWQGKIDQAIALLDSAGKNTLVSRLKVFKQMLIKTPPVMKSQIRSTLVLQEFMSNENEVTKGKKFVIWGTGSNYRNCFKDWLQKNESYSDFKGFIENDPDRWGKRLDGHLVHPPDYLKEDAELDYVLIASSFRSQIIQQIHSMGVTKPEII